MKINELIRKLDDLVLNSSAPFPFCNSEEGANILLVAPCSAKAGTIFVGALSDWEAVVEQHLLCDGCTYLICCKNEIPEIPFLRQEINIFFLDASLSIVLKRLADLFTQKQKHSISDTNKMYLEFWEEVMSFSITTQQQFVERMRRFPYPVHRHIACIVIVYSQSQTSDDSGEQITRALQEFFPGINLFFTGEEWIVIYSQEQDTSDRLNISYDDFSQLLENYQLDAGISYVCQLPELLRSDYLTAAASIDLGRRLSIKPYINRIYTYHQYNPYYVIQLCSRNFVELHKTDNLIYLTHPDITRIYFYDRENNSNLLDVLFTYLSCNQNIVQTSQILYMHRNTVLNKLRKIDEFLKHEFDYNKDRFLLQLSCMIIHYQHNYTKHNISEYFQLHDFEVTNISCKDDDVY